MKSSLDRWSTSISSIIQKAESNLTKSRNSNSDFFHKKDTIYSEQSIPLTNHSVNPFIPDDPPALSLHEFRSFKSQMFEKLSKQDLEFEKFKKRFSIRERSEIEITCLREDLNFSLSAIEKKFLSEINKFAVVIGNSVQEKCKLSQEELKREFFESFSNVEQKIGEIRESVKGLRKELSSEAQMGFEEIGKKIRKIEFNDDKKMIFKEIEEARIQNKENFEELSKVIEVNKEEMRKRFRRDLEKIDNRMKESLNEFAGISEQNSSYFIEFNQKLSSLKESNEDLSRSVKKLHKNKRKIKLCQQSLEAFQLILGKLPDFTEFYKKFEVTEILETLLDKHHKSEALFISDLNQIKEVLNTFSEFAKKSDLECQCNEFLRKLELVKLASIGKTEFGKFKKQIIRGLKNSERTPMILENTPKGLNDSFINKLVQIEQRVCVLEDLYENDSPLEVSGGKLYREEGFHTSKENKNRGLESLRLSKVTAYREDSGFNVFEETIGEELLAMKDVNSPHYSRRFSERLSPD